MPSSKRPFFVTLVLCGTLLSSGLGFPFATDLLEAAGFRDAVISDSHLDKESQTVYVTDKGKKYHVDGCRYLKDSKRPLSLDEAKKTHSPCKVCKAPE